MLVAWHQSGEKKPSKLQAGVLRKGLLKGNDLDHNFHNCLRELQSQTIPSFGRRQGPSSHSHFLQHLNPSVKSPPRPRSSLREGRTSRDRSHASRRAGGGMHGTRLTPHHLQDCTRMVTPLSFSCQNPCQIPLPRNHGIITLKKPKSFKLR